VSHTADQVVSTIDGGDEELEARLNGRSLSVSRSGRYKNRLQIRAKLSSENVFHQNVETRAEEISVGRMPSHAIDVIQHSSTGRHQGGQSRSPKSHPNYAANDEHKRLVSTSKGNGASVPGGSYRNEKVDLNRTRATKQISNGESGVKFAPARRTKSKAVTRPSHSCSEEDLRRTSGSFSEPSTNLLRVKRSSSLSRQKKESLKIFSGSTSEQYNESTAF